jgi:allene oxide cyclase
MRKALVFTLALAFVALAVGSVALSGGASTRATSSTTIHVIEHAITDTEVPSRDTLGALLVFHNSVYDAADKQQVGHDNGDCVRTVVGKVWECFWTVFLPAGQITVEGPYYDNNSDSLLAITGGTGQYQQARGQMKLHARGKPVGSEFDFIYMLAN